MKAAPSIYQALARLETCNETGALCTVVHSQGATPRHPGSKMLVYPDGSILGSVGGGEMESRVLTEALQALADGQPRLIKYTLAEPERGDPGVCGGRMEVFVEPVLSKPALLVVGCGHVGKAVARLARWLGFWVAASDDRAELCTPEAFPDADAYYPLSLADLPAQMKITFSTYVVLTTRGVPVDVQGLPSLLDTPAAYIGVIGSQRRWATTRSTLLEQGLPAESIDRVHSPMGLELYAETPEEIAVSILAEIIMLRNRADGQPMKR